MASSPFTVVRAPADGGGAAYTHYSGDRPRKHDADLDEDMELDTDAGPRLAMPGQPVASSTLYMRGHGCYIDAANSEIISSLSGTVDRVNKLISVHSARTRYRPEVGDLVIGRVTEVQARRWRVDIGSRTDASLQLSSVNLPGGVQRKKLESDELQMRSYFQEGDLLVAEVQSIFNDGSVGLHTRSLRYGKLRNGVLVAVPPVLIRRLKSHFITLRELRGGGVDLVLGLNGLIWVAKHIPFDAAKAEAEGAADSGEAVGPAGRGVGMDIDGVYSDVNEHIAPETRTSIALVCFALTAMAHHGVPISDARVEQACAVLSSSGVPEREWSGQTGVRLAAQVAQALAETL